MSWLKKTLLFLLAIIVAAIGWILVTNTADGVADTAQTLDLADQTRLIRWGLLGAIIIFWSDLVDLFKKRLSDEQVFRAKNMHWRVAVALVVFEVLVVESALTMIY